MLNRPSLSPIITLTTDFGHADEYVGVLKGVVLSRSPQARLVDLCHTIPPQDVAQAALLLGAAAPFFPPGTIHLAVVDPGVGTSRRLIATRANGQMLVGPDNGIFSAFLTAFPIEEVVVIDCPQHYLSPVSATFHGRDILAPVAAALANGIPLATIGPRVVPETLVKVIQPELQIDSIHGNMTGAIIHQDHFGNLTTNIHQRDITRLGANPASLRVFLGSHRIDGLSTTYGTSRPGALLALIGSRGFLELAQCMGNAAQFTGAAVGDRVGLVIRHT